MRFGPTPFPGLAVRAIVIRPDQIVGGGYEVGALMPPRGGSPAKSLRGPTHVDDLDRAWILARDIRRTSGLPILDRSDSVPADPTPDVAA